MTCVDLRICVPSRIFATYVTFGFKTSGGYALWKSAQDFMGMWIASEFLIPDVAQL